MTPAETKHYIEWFYRSLPALTSWADGKPVEADNDNGTWSAVTEPSFSRFVEWRPVPEPKPRQYTDAELKEQVGKVLQRKSTGDTHLVTCYSVEHKTVSISLFGSVRADTVFEEFTHLDGSPCGVTE